MTREATTAEIAARFAFYIRRGDKVQYRHGISERLCRKARNGVQHVQHTSAKLVVQDDKVFVSRRGSLSQLTATVWTADDGREHVLDLREAYLKSSI